MTEDKGDKPTCFVIQTFDGGKYDRRYKEVIRPALEKAGVEPQRADEILGLNPIIEKIETAIEAASICLVDVSEDNPNVWLEVGYALALHRPTVILCDRVVRAKLPFDVQHRPVIFYRTESRSDFDNLEASIIRSVKHELSTERRIHRAPTLKPGSEASSDLEPYEVAILSTALAFWPTPAGTISYWELEKKLDKNRYTDVDFALGISTLLERNYIVQREVSEEDSYGNQYPTKHYQITPEGISWIRQHKDVLTTQSPPDETTASQGYGKTFKDDDIPF